MLEQHETNPTKRPVPPHVPILPENVERLTFFYLISFMLACLDRISSDSVSDVNMEDKWLDEWSDDQNLYLETRIPAEDSGMEIDIHVGNGRIYARIAQRIDGESSS